MAWRLPSGLRVYCKTRSTAKSYKPPNVDAHIDTTGDARSIANCYPIADTDANYPPIPHAVADTHSAG